MQTQSVQTYMTAAITIGKTIQQQISVLCKRETKILNFRKTKNIHQVCNKGSEKQKN